MYELKAKLTSGNTLHVNIGNIFVGGSFGGEIYDGEYIVTPSTNSEQTLNTANKLMKENVVVKEIPYFEVSNNSGGNTVYIGNEV